MRRIDLRKNIPFRDRFYYILKMTDVKSKNYIFGATVFILVDLLVFCSRHNSWYDQHGKWWGTLVTDIIHDQNYPKISYCWPDPKGGTIWKQVPMY